MKLAKIAAIYVICSAEICHGSGIESVEFGLLENSASNYRFEKGSDCTLCLGSGPIDRENCNRGVGNSNSQQTANSATDGNELSFEAECNEIIETTSTYLHAGEIGETISLIDKLTALSRADKAPKILKNRLNIRIAVIGCLAGKFQLCWDALEEIDDNILSPSEMAWKLAAQCALMRTNGDDSLVNDMQQKAISMSSSLDQIAQIQAFLLNVALNQSQNRVNMVKQIKAAKDMYSLYKFQKIGHPFAKAYALLLVRTGEQEAAQKLLRDEIEKVEKDDIQTIQTFKLYYAIVSGVQTDDGHKVIRELLMSDVTQDLKMLSLKVLLSTACNQKQQLASYDLLSSTAPEKSSEKIARAALLTKFMLAVKANNVGAIKHALDDFSKEFQYDNALCDMYKLAACAALGLDPKDYMAAAGFLSQAKSVAGDDVEMANIDMNIGHTFFSCGSLDLAKRSYENVLEYQVSGVQYEKALHQLVQCDIKLNDLDDANQTLLQFREKHDLTGLYRWKAELAYINALVNSNKYETAAKYMSDLFGRYKHEIPAPYLVKMYLLHAFSLFFNGKVDDAHSVTSEMCKIFDKENISSEVAQIMAQALLIKGVCELSAEKIPEALATFQTLRKEYQSSDQATLSYFEEARHFCKFQKINEAIDALLKVVEQGNKYSALAYYKIAEIYKNNGSGSYDAAAKSFSKVISEYGNDDIAYSAQMLIADIFMMRGQFGSAEIIYEDVIKTHPLDQRNRIAELRLAKAIFAQRGRGGIFAEKARIILDNLYSTVEQNSPLQMEVAAMYCFVLDRMGLKQDMRDVAWKTVLDSTKSGDDITEHDRYWLKQITNILAKSYSKEERNSSEFETLQEIIKKTSGK